MAALQVMNSFLVLALPMPLVLPLALTVCEYAKPCIQMTEELTY
jgi:hypothetical protein